MVGAPAPSDSGRRCDSSLTTSAPSSAKIMAEVFPATNAPKLNTRTPVNESGLELLVSDHTRLPPSGQVDRTVAKFVDKDVIVVLAQLRCFTSER